MIECDSIINPELCPGNQWYHLKCVKLLEQDIPKISTYICESCSIRTGKTTIFYQDLQTENDTNATPRIEQENAQEPDDDRQSNDNTKQNQNTNDTSQMGLHNKEIHEDINRTESNSNSNQENIAPEIEKEFEVKGIHGHGGYSEDPSKMMFLIEWEGYPDKKEYTWEFEDSLTKCYDIVKKYRQQKKLGPTKLKPIGRAIDDDRNHKIVNWVTPERLLEAAKTYLNHERYSTELKIISEHISEYKKERADAILIILRENHYHAILWLPKQKKALIGDGSNLSLKEDVQNDLKNILGVKPEPIRVDKRIKIDYYASAAILIALEFARYYKKEDLKIPFLDFPQSLYDRLTKYLHPESSTPQQGRKNIREVHRFLTCKFCLVHKTTKGRGPLATHEKQCKKNPANM